MKISDPWMNFFRLILSTILIFGFGIMAYVSVSLVGEVNPDLIDPNIKTLFASLTMIFLTLYSLLFLQLVRMEWKKNEE